MHPLHQDICFSGDADCLIAVRCALNNLDRGFRQFPLPRQHLDQGGIGLAGLRNSGDHSLDKPVAIAIDFYRRNPVR